MTTQIKIFCGSRPAEIEKDINKFFDEVKENKKFFIVSVTQSECENDITISIVYQLIA